MTSSNASAPVTVTVTATATKLNSGGAGSSGCRIKNKGATTLFLGVSNAVAASGANEGWEVAAGAEFYAESIGGEIWGIFGSGSGSVKVWAMSRIG